MQQLAIQDVDQLQKLLIAPPVMPWRDFASWICMSEDLVEHWVKRGYLPTVRIGRYRMVNVALLVQQLLNTESEV
ncbi:MAG: DNA-binding protein [Gammaproteobacteria bacterium]|nr:DNA-binding protein [Gammaproteobacteria bacterium]